jgi:cytoskeleton protein RodZ
MSESDDRASEGHPTLTGQVRASTVSSMLAEARKAKKLSRQQVADRLYLSVSYIENIDDGRFEEIPKPAFIRGYLRSYARIVGISGDEVVNCFEEMGRVTDVESDALRNVTEEEVGPAKFTGPVAQTGLFGLAGVGLLIFLVWWLIPLEEDVSMGGYEIEQQIDGSADQPDPLTVPDSEMAGDLPIGLTQQGVTDESLTEMAVGSETALSVAEDHVPTGSTEEQSPGGASAPIALESEETGDRSAATESGMDVTIERYEDGEYRIINVAADGEDHLQFTFVDECWLEVEDARDNPIYMDLNHANDIVDIYAQAPFKILIGHAQSVTLQFNDQPVSLVPNISNDTAQLVVGN